MALVRPKRRFASPFPLSFPRRRCSSRRGAVSTKLQGAWRMSDSLDGPKRRSRRRVSGQAKQVVPIRPAVARDWMVEVPILAWLIMWKTTEEAVDPLVRATASGVTSRPGEPGASCGDRRRRRGRRRSATAVRIRETSSGTMARARIGRPSTRSAGWLPTGRRQAARVRHGEHRRPDRDSRVGLHHGAPSSRAAGPCDPDPPISLASCRRSAVRGPSSRRKMPNMVAPEPDMRANRQSGSEASIRAPRSRSSGAAVAAPARTGRSGSCGARPGSISDSETFDEHRRQGRLSAGARRRNTRAVSTWQPRD